MHYVITFLLTFTTISSVLANAKNQCLVCHVNDSHYLGKGEILSRWASTNRSLERTGHFWFKPSDFRKLSKKFLAWSQPKKSFYLSLMEAEDSEQKKASLERILKSELSGYSSIGSQLKTDFKSARQILENPFHSLQFESKNLSYTTTITTRLQRILMVFGGSSEVRTAKFNLRINNSDSDTTKGLVQLTHLSPSTNTSEGLFEIDHWGNLIKLQRIGEKQDPFLRNCAWLFQRPQLIEALPLKMTRPIGLETGKVLKQPEMEAQININDVRVERHSDQIELKVFYDFEPARSRGQLRIVGGNGTASVDLRGILLRADAELAISLRVFGVDLKGWLSQQILRVQ